MGKVALRGLLANKLRMIMTLAAVALGVAFIAGVLVFTDTMQRSFDDLFEVAYEGIDAVARSDQVISGELGLEDERGTLDEALLETVRAVPTVAAASGEVEGFAQILDPDGDAVSGGSFGGPTFVASIDIDAPGEWDELNEFGLRDGAWPAANDEIVVDAATEDRIEYGIGDSVPIQTQAGLTEYTLVGTVGFGSSDSVAGQGIVLFTTEEAQRTVGDLGRLDAISVIATDGTSPEQVVADIRAVVGPGVEVLSGEEMVQDVQSDVRQALSFITIFFLVFAVVAVVVGAFVIYNSFSIIIAQRTREMALLRAIGASRKQVRRAVLVEAVVTGAVGSAMGFGLGLGLAAVFSSFLIDVDSSLAILPTSVAIAVLVGLVVTVASSLLPAWRASRVPPVAAMRDVDIDTTGRSLVRLLVGAGLLGLGFVLAGWGAVDRAVDTVGLGVVGTFIGLILVSPGLAQPVGRVLGWPLARLRGITGALAQQNAARNPRRTASTALALMIGVAIVSFFLILNASIRGSFDQVVDDNFAGDFVIEAGGQGLLGLPEEISQAVAELPEVDRVTPMRFVDATVGDGTGLVLGTSPSFFDAFGFETESSTELEPGEVVVRQGTAESDGLSLGDTVTLDFLDADPATVTVTGFYEESPGMSFGNYVVGLEELTEHVAGAPDNMIVIDLASGAGPDEAREAISGVVTAVAPTAEVQDNEDLKESLGRELDAILQIVLALLLFAIVIAFFGIANTVALSVMERTRELGLLRAVGMSRRQLRSAIRWESVIIALFGTTLGLAVGILGSWGMVTALHDEGFEVFSLPIGVLVGLAVLAGLAGVGAALWPAWRASRLNILDAIHHE